MNELEKLKKENKKLKSLLAAAQTWMKKEVKEQTKKISKKKVNNMTNEVKESFLKENMEKVISKQINNFFWEVLLLNMPSSIVENIISAEINYYNLKQNPELDWFSVLSSYHKALDTLIENYITKWFRKYAKKTGQIYLRKNDLLEKSLNSVINKWFILSTWRLFHLIKLIKKDEELFDYGNCFLDYLNKYYYLKDTLLEDSFYNLFEEIIASEVLWKKRHSWNITFEETTKAREILIWNFENKNCIIYKLIESQNLDF